MTPNRLPSAHSGEDGGHAFPARVFLRDVYDAEREEHGIIYARQMATVTAPGMSLRDYFAGKALAGLLAHPHPDHSGEVGPEIIAQDAYAVADAMLAERGR